MSNTTLISDNKVAFRRSQQFLARPYRASAPLRPSSSANQATPNRLGRNKNRSNKSLLLYPRTSAQDQQQSESQHTNEQHPSNDPIIDLTQDEDKPTSPVSFNSDEYRLARRLQRFQRLYASHRDDYYPDSSTPSRFTDSQDPPKYYDKTWNSTFYNSIMKFLGNTNPKYNRWIVNEIFTNNLVPIIDPRARRLFGSSSTKTELQIKILAQERRLRFFIRGHQNHNSI